MDSKEKERMDSARMRSILKTVATVYGWAWDDSTDAAEAFCEAVLVSTKLEDALKMGQVAAHLDLLDFRRMEKERLVQTALIFARCPYREISMDAMSLILQYGGHQLFSDNDYRDLLQNTYNGDVRNFLLSLPEVNPNMRMLNGKPLIIYLIPFPGSFVYMLDTRTPELNVDITTNNGDHLEELVVQWIREHRVHDPQFSEIETLIKTQERVRAHLTQMHTAAFSFLAKPLPKVLFPIIWEFVYFPAKPKVGNYGLTALKSWLNERLRPLVKKRDRILTNKITRMILKRPNHEILELLDSDSKLDAAVRAAADAAVRAAAAGVNRIQVDFDTLTKP